tara:strand:- start:25754 stop:26026 length:273 start_codon:yes stop_codon:yes gene_type:complete
MPFDLPRCICCGNTCSRPKAKSCSKLCTDALTNGWGRTIQKAYERILNRRGFQGVPDGKESVAVISESPFGFRCSHARQAINTSIETYDR